MGSRDGTRVSLATTFTYIGSDISTIFIFHPERELSISRAWLRDPSLTLRMTTLHDGFAAQHDRITASHDDTVTLHDDFRPLSGLYSTNASLLRVEMIE